MLRIVVAAPPFVREPADLAALPRCADLVELRLDLLLDLHADLHRDHLPGGLDEDRLAAWILASPRPVLATVRSVAEGGAFRGQPSEAARLLEAAARLGARWIDVERGVAPFLAALPEGVRVLASTHGEGDAVFPERIAGRLPDATKVARPVADAAGLARLCAEGRGASPATTFVPYGPLAALRAAFVGSRDAFLFGAASAGSAVVAGQPTLASLLDELRAGEVTPEASWYGLLGDPPAASPSPSIHNAAFRALSMDALYVPLPGMSLLAALALPFRGYSVTTPLKTEAARCADVRSPEVEATGAANTLVRADDGRWAAYNTDVEAVAGVVPPATKGEAAFVYGAGGFARAAVFALRNRGYRVRLGARDAARAREATRACGVPFAGDVYRREPEDRVVVNATPAGADGASVAAFPEELLAGLRVLDAPYAPPGRETALVRAARRADAVAVVSGLDLLVAQARGQSFAFTGRRVEDLVLRRAVRPSTNLVLVGLRGAGKTTVGRLVAARLGRPFLDLDAEVARLTDRPTAGAFIRERGIEAFRAAELEAVARVAGRRGLVVATGGGALEDPANVAVLREAAVGVWLDVPPDVARARLAADAGDRPALMPGTDPDVEARALADRRAPAWRAFAAAIVDAAKPPGIVARRVVEAWVLADAP